MGTSGIDLCISLHLLVARSQPIVESIFTFLSSDVLYGKFENFLFSNLRLKVNIKSVKDILRFTSVTGKLRQEW